MTIRFALPAALLAFFRGVPSVVETISPEPVDDLCDLRRHHGLSQIMRASRDNVVRMAEARRRFELTAASESSPIRKAVERG